MNCKSFSIAQLGPIEIVQFDDNDDDDDIEGILG